MKKSHVMYSIVAAVALCASLAGIAQAAPVSSLNSQPHVSIQKFMGAIPLWKSARKITSSGVSKAASTSIPPCLDNPTPSPIAPRCYSPQQIRNAYDVTLFTVGRNTSFNPSPSGVKADGIKIFGKQISCVSNPALRLQPLACVTVT